MPFVTSQRFFFLFFCFFESINTSCLPSPCKLSCVTSVINYDNNKARWQKKIFTACGAGFVLEASGMLFTCGGDGRPRLSFHRSSFLSTSLNRWMSLLAILSAVYKKKKGLLAMFCYCHLFCHPQKKKDLYSNCPARDGVRVIIYRRGWVCRSCFSFKWTVITRVANHSWPPVPHAPPSGPGVRFHVWSRRRRVTQSRPEPPPRQHHC